MELQGRLKELQAKGIGLAAISYDPPEILAAFSKQHAITFPLLSDTGSATITRYGILNPQAGARAGIPFPGTFMLDRRGRVTARFFEDFYVERNTTSSVMLKLGTATAPVSATKVSSAQLDLTTYPSDATVAVGNHFTLALDIVPKRGMHVYAPGARGYRVINLIVAPPPFVRVGGLQYPPSEIYHFRPLNERVAVYQKRFVLLQDVVVEGTPEAQAALKGRDSLTINGTLEYQACDDKLCYNPVSLPLTWTVGLRPLITERPRP